RTSMTLTPIVRVVKTVNPILCAFLFAASPFPAPSACIRSGRGINPSATLGSHSGHGGPDPLPGEKHVLCPSPVAGVPRRGDLGEPDAYCRLTTADRGTPSARRRRCAQRRP